MNYQTPKLREADRIAADRLKDEGEYVHLICIKGEVYGAYHTVAAAISGATRCVAEHGTKEWHQTGGYIDLTEGWGNTE